MKVVGLDLSLTSTGVAVATQNGAVTDRITSKPVRKVGKGDPPLTIGERAARLDELVDDIVEHVSGADLVVVEGPSLGQSRQAGEHGRAGLWWLVAWRLWARNLPVVEVTPAGVKRYATGNGGAAKDDVLSAVIRRYPTVDVNGHDEADALVLAAMGARFLGHPLETFVPTTGGHHIPQTHLAAMGAVHWPDRDAIPA